MIFHRVPTNGAGPVHGMIVAFLYIVFQEFFTKKDRRFSYGLNFWGQATLCFFFKVGELAEPAEVNVKRGPL